MSWIDKIFRKEPKKTTYAKTVDGWAPVFSQYGTNIYAFDVVQQALKCIVDEMKKLNPVHIRYRDNDPMIMHSTIQDVLQNPNELMTTSEFIEKVTWLLLMNYNAFILPCYSSWIDPKTGQERRYYEALYPLKPTEVDFIEDLSGKLYIRFKFVNGEKTTVPYDQIIHIRYNYSVNQYMGGDAFGQPDHKPLLDTLNLNNDLLNGIAKAMNASYAINGVVKYNTMFDEGETIAALQELERKLNHSESGFLPLDMKAEFTPLERKTQLVDSGALKFVDEKILRNWGISLPILTGDYTKEQYEAFYQKAIEPILKTFDQSFTKHLFTKRERAFNNKIKFYPEDLVFLSTTQKIELLQQLSPTGALYENEKRTMFGMMPLPELSGKRYMSLNWIDAENATQYQVGKSAEDDKQDDNEDQVNEPDNAEPDNAPDNNDEGGNNDE